MNRSRVWAPLAVLALVQSLLFAYYLAETMIRQPYWDMYSHVMRFLQLQRDGAWWAYLWEPHVQHRQVWMRLLTAFDAEAFSGTSYPFIAFATACHIATVWLIWTRVRTDRPDARGGLLACLAVMLLLTAVAAVDCAIPINGVYPQALAFIVGAFVLFDGPAGEPLWWRRLAAVTSAVAGAFANAAALTAWPILVWYSWRTRAGWRWSLAITAFGVLFSFAYLNGLPLAPVGDGGFDGRLSAAEVRQGASYLFYYLGLPWTRAAALAPAGQVVGAVLFFAGVASVVWYGWLRRADRLERLAVALIVFSLATACLAAAGRADVESATGRAVVGSSGSDVVVPVRYAVFVAPMHVGLLILGWPLVFSGRGVRAASSTHVQISRREYMAAAVLGIILLVQQVASGQQAVATTRSMREVLDRFAAGEQSDDMRAVVFIDLRQARRDFDAIRSAGLYRDAR